MALQAACLLGIPLAARLMAVADVFDALTSPRVYKTPVSADEARRVIVADSGQHFDPDVVQAFDRCFDHLVEIAHALAAQDVMAPAA